MRSAHRYFEADDKDLVQARMAATEVNVRWQAKMAELFTGAGNPDDEVTYLTQVFDLNDQLDAAGLPVDPAPTTTPA